MNHVYVEEYEKMKEDYDSEITKKDKQIKNITFENQRLHKEILSYLDNI